MGVKIKKKCSNIRTIRLTMIRLAEHVLRMDMDRLTRRVWEAIRKTREKMGTKCVIEIKKYWTKIGIQVEGKDTQQMCKDK